MTVSSVVGAASVNHQVYAGPAKSADAVRECLIRRVCESFERGGVYYDAGIKNPSGVEYRLAGLKRVGK